MESRLAELRERSPWRKAKTSARKVNYAFNGTCSPNGTPMTREQLAKRKRKPGARRRASVRCLDTGETFDSLVAASEALGMHANALAKAFNVAKKRNREFAIAGGRQWVRV